LPQRDLRFRPPLARREVGRHRNLEVLCTDHMLEDAVSGVIPNIDAEREIK